MFETWPRWARLTAVILIMVVFLAGCGWAFIADVVQLPASTVATPSPFPSTYGPPPS